MTNQHILIFSIGPVQSFISQARKTQDLYGGSRLLSHLCLAAIDFAKSKNIEIIFPFIDETAKSIPNRFVGILKNTEGVDIQKLGEDIEQAVQDEFVKIVNGTLDYYKIGHINGFKEQIENHLDINWLFYPIETNYETDYAEAEKWLGAVKNIRIFKQNPEKGRKCTLDGERNVKIYRLGEGEKAKDLLYSKLFQNEGDVWIVGDNSKIPLSMLGNGEGISAVSFVKRAFEKNETRKEPDFPSTARISLMNSLKKIWNNGDEGIKALVEYQNEFMGTTFDEQLFFEENLNKDYFKKNGYASLINKLPQIELRYKLFKEYLRKRQLDLQKYYALIVFDGDNMGKLISGEFLNDKTVLPQFQAHTSKLLSEYAKWADNYLDDPKGKTVYAGGDDFLGFVNLTYLYEAIQELYDKFKCSVSQPLKEEFEGNIHEDFEFTFSAGIAIAHYKTPLSIVLKKAREMEHIAKEKGDRDAFAIAVLKHSGESHETVFKWENLQNLKYVHEQLQAENFSNTFIKNIQLELGDFEGNFKNPKNDFVKIGVGEQIAKKEIKRLIKRSQMNFDLSEKSMQDSVLTVFEKSANFENFVEALNIAQFTKRQIKSA